jgi:hypothetical protein
MGLKGYRLWVMGQLDSTCRAPPHPLPGGIFTYTSSPRRKAAYKLTHLKANFEAQDITFKVQQGLKPGSPGYHIQGATVESPNLARSSAMGKLDSACWGSAG